MDNSTMEIKPYANFAKSSIAVIGQYTVRPRKIQRKQLRNMMVNPYLNWEGLQGISALMMGNNGNYERLVSYFGSMSTYDHVLYPLNATGKVANKNNNFKKSYLEACQLVQKMNLKHNCRWWGKRLVQQGELYLYKIEDSSGIIYQELPTFICRTNRIENGVLRYQVDLPRIDIYLLSTLPLEIQNIYQKWCDGEYKYNWYDVSDNGVAFNLWGNSLTHGFPYLSFLFDKLLAVEDFEDMNEDLTKVDNLKLIHQTIPMDDKGNILMDEELASIYHSTTKKNLPKGVTITTNPLKMEVVNLQTSGNENARGLSYVQNALKSVYDSVGVNINLFNGEIANNVILQAGIVTDEQLAYTMLLMFQTYLNLDLSKRKINGMVWQLKILDTTCYNRELRLNDARANLSLGGSKMEFLSLSGYTPLEGYQVLTTEQTLGFNDLFTPVMTSYTMSANSDTVSQKDGNINTEEKQAEAQAVLKSEQTETAMIEKDENRITAKTIESNGEMT